MNLLLVAQISGFSELVTHVGLEVVFVFPRKLRLLDPCLDPLEVDFFLEWTFPFKYLNALFHEEQYSKL